MPVNIFVAESVVPKLDENNRKMTGVRADRSGKTSSAVENNSVMIRVNSASLHFLFLLRECLAM